MDYWCFASENIGLNPFAGRTCFSDHLSGGGQYWDEGSLIQLESGAINAAALKLKRGLAPSRDGRRPIRKYAALVFMI
jgi:hypothetical protein